MQEKLEKSFVNLHLMTKCKAVQTCMESFNTQQCRSVENYITEVHDTVGNLIRIFAPLQFKKYLNFQRDCIKGKV